MLAAMVFMAFTSCDGIMNRRSTPFYGPSDNGPVNSQVDEEVEVEEEEEEPKEAEKRPRSFYQKLLESFCQRYYNSCFSGRDYHYNSIIVDRMDVIQGNWENGNIVSWNMWVKGRHSFEGSVKNHNDSPFEAFVHELGDNNYEVTFCIKRYDIFGDQMDDEEEATRTITFVE